MKKGEKLETIVTSAIYTAVFGLLAGTTNHSLGAILLYGGAAGTLTGLTQSLTKMLRDDDTPSKLSFSKMPVTGALGYCTGTVAALAGAGYLIRYVA